MVGLHVGERKREEVGELDLRVANNELSEVCGHLLPLISEIKKLK